MGVSKIWVVCHPPAALRSVPCSDFSQPQFVLQSQKLKVSSVHSVFWINIHNCGNTPTDYLTMDEVRTPIVWNKPKPRIYNYNQEITGCFYQVCYSKVLNTNNDKNIPFLAHAWLCWLKGKAGDFLRETSWENSLARARRVGPHRSFQVQTQ